MRQGDADRRLVLAALVAAIVVVALFFVGTAGASPGDHSAPLDSGFEKVGETTVDGTTYEVYRYDNLLPYASGYELFADGERVDDRDKVRRVARVYAWETAAREEVTDEELELLRSTATTTRRASAVVSAPFTAIDTALSLVDELDEREAPLTNTSIWDIATSASPRLGTAESLLRTTRDGLEDWEESLGSIGGDVTDAVDAVEALREGETPEDGYEELNRVFENATDGLHTAEETSSALRSDLNEGSNISGDLAEEISGIRLVGEELASPFRSLERSLSNVSNRVKKFEEDARSSREKLETVSSRASTTERSVNIGWRRRASAEARVYGTFVFLILLIAGGAYAYRRREEIYERFGPEEGNRDAKR